MKQIITLCEESKEKIFIFTLQTCTCHTVIGYKFTFFIKKKNRIFLTSVDIFIAYVVYMYEMITWQYTRLPIIFPLQPFRSFQRYYHALPNNRKGRKKSFDGKFACRKTRSFENDRVDDFSWSLYDPLWAATISLTEIF